MLEPIPTTTLRYPSPPLEFAAQRAAAEAVLRGERAAGISISPGWRKLYRTWKARGRQPREAFAQLLQNLRHTVWLADQERREIDFRRRLAKRKDVGALFATRPRWVKEIQALPDPGARLRLLDHVLVVYRDTPLGIHCIYLDPEIAEKLHPQPRVKPHAAGALTVAITVRAVIDRPDRSEKRPPSRRAWTDVYYHLRTLGLTRDVAAEVTLELLSWWGLAGSVPASAESLVRDWDNLKAQPVNTARPSDRLDSIR